MFSVVMARDPSNILLVMYIDLTKASAGLFSVSKVHVTQCMNNIVKTCLCAVAFAHLYHIHTFFSLSGSVFCNMSPTAAEPLHQLH